MERFLRENPEFTGNSSTQGLRNRGDLVDQGRAGSDLTANNDLARLEAFGFNEQDDAGIRAGRLQTGVLNAFADREGADRRAAEARDRAARGADVDAGTFERRTRGRISERQRKSAARRLGLSRAINIASAGSGSRRRTTDRAIGARKAIADFEADAFRQELGGRTNLARAEAARVGLANQREANKEANRNSLIGSAVGLGASLLMLSSESAKTKEGPAENILDKLRKVRIEKWKYKGDDQTHVGPYAEEFNETFETGQGKKDPRFISLVDAIGITMGAVKELNEKVEARG